jgi:hypothetical protein
VKRVWRRVEDFILTVAESVFSYKDANEMGRVDLR